MGTVLQKIQSPGGAYSAIALHVFPISCVNCDLVFTIKILLLIYHSTIQFTLYDVIRMVYFQEIILKSFPMFGCNFMCMHKVFVAFS